MNRYDLQELAQIRIGEAQALLGASLHDGAYYLGGYAVECALKACIAKGVSQFDFPDKNLTNKAYTHKLTELVAVAGLQQELEEKINADEEFGANWLTVKDWSEESRYQRHADLKTRAFLIAITDPEKGVLPWLQDRW